MFVFVGHVCSKTGLFTVKWSEVGVSVERPLLSAHETKGSHCRARGKISGSMAVARVLVKYAELDGDFGRDLGLHSRTDLIKSSGCEGDVEVFCSATTKRDTSDLIFPSFIPSSHELPWQLASSARACVSW